MLFVMGLLFQSTSPLASIFIAMSHNVTEIYEENVLYSYGVKDLALIFFYILISIVVHAIIQEYVLDKINRKLHLSKIKHSKFNESGQLLIFYLFSVLWGGEVIRREGYLWSISKLWIDYPFHHMSYLCKLYFIVQIAYWLHNFPELYLQKVKKDEMVSRITYSSFYLFFFTAAYSQNFTRIALCLSIIHYTAEALFHFSRLCYFADITSVSDYGFKLWNVLFVVARLATITLSVLTFWYGLAINQKSTLSFIEGNFNTQLVRINCLLTLFLLQAWMMWNFITFHLKRIRERNLEKHMAKKKSHKNQSKKSTRMDEDVNELPEVDQNINKIVTQRITSKAGKVKH